MKQKRKKKGSYDDSKVTHFSLKNFRLLLVRNGSLSALADVTGTVKTVPSCREKRFEKKRGKRRSNSPPVVKVFANKFGQVVEKSFEHVMCLCCFVKAAKFRDSNEYSDCT